MTEVGSCSREAGGREAWGQASVGPTRGELLHSSGRKWSVTLHLQTSSNADWLSRSREAHPAHRSDVRQDPSTHPSHRSLNTARCD